MYPGGDQTAVTNEGRCYKCGGHGQLRRSSIGKGGRRHAVEPHIWFQWEPSAHIYPREMVDKAAMPCDLCAGTGVIGA